MLNMESDALADFAIRAKAIRRRILEVAHQTQSPHVGSSLSCVEITLAAYSLKLVQARTKDARSRVVFSKGHASLAVYATLENLGLIDHQSLDSYNANGSHFYGHVSKLATEQVELTTGSLGHGLPFAVGLSMGESKSIDKNCSTYVIMSDGECDEGTTWESALIAAHFKLQDFYVIIDRNRLQSLEDTETTLALEPFAEKWRSFGWDVVEVDGHSPAMLMSALQGATRPRCVIANTHKGEGVSFMKDQVLWHYRPPGIQELHLALSELDTLNEK
jgi:transketolase